MSLTLTESRRLAAGGIPLLWGRGGGGGRIVRGAWWCMVVRVVMVVAVAVAVAVGWGDGGWEGQTASRRTSLEN